MGKGQVRRDCQGPFGLGQCADLVAAQPQQIAEDCVGLRIGIVERNRPTGQSLDRALCRRQAAYLKLSGRLGLSDGEALAAPGEGWVEINRLLKESLRERVVIRAVFAQVPQPRW